MANSHIEGFRRYMATASDLSEGSRTRYVYEVERFFSLAEKTLEDLQPRDILDWNAMLQEGGAAPGTVGQKRAALRCFLEYREDFEDDEHAGRLLRAMKHLKMPVALAPRRQAHSLTKEQVQRILEAAAERPGVGIRDRALIHFLYASGTRRAEARNLSLPNLDLDHRVGQVLGKGAKWRTVGFDSGCQKQLAIWLDARTSWEIEPEVLEVFVSASGHALNLDTIGSIVRDAGKRAGLADVWTHILRHSRITALLSGGMSIATTAKLAGHGNPKTTMAYFHPADSDLMEEYDRATQ